MNGSKTNKIKRCPNGTRKNNKGDCIKTHSFENGESNKKERCEKGTRRNKLSGKCEPLKNQSVTTKKK